MKILILSLFAFMTFAQVDSMRVTWTEAPEADLYGTIIYGDTIALPTTVIDTVLAGTEFLEWKPSYAGLWRIRAKSLDDSSNTSAYSSVDTVTIWRDSIPSQFTFYDSTGAAVSSEIITRLPVVLSGFDSAQGTITGGDYRVGALGSWSRATAFFNTGDSVWVKDTTSASNSDTSNVILTIAGIKDTFTVVTESGGFSPSDLSPVLYLVHDDSVTASGSKTVTKWVDNGFEFIEDSTNGKVVQTDSSIFFNTTDTEVFSLADAAGNPFDFGLGDISIEVWLYSTNAGYRIMSKNSAGGYAQWVIETSFAGPTGVAFTFTSAGADTTGGIAQYGTDIANKWSHIVLTLDRNVGAQMYIDSVIKTTEFTSEWTDMATVNMSTTSATLIGDASLGHIAVIRFYNYCLTPANVKSLYEYGRE